MAIQQLHLAKKSLKRGTQIALCEVFASYGFQFNIKSLDEGANVFRLSLTLRGYTLLFVMVQQLEAVGYSQHVAL